MSVPGSCGGQERASDPVGLESQHLLGGGRRHILGAANWVSSFSEIACLKAMRWQAIGEDTKHRCVHRCVRAQVCACTGVCVLRYVHPDSHACTPHPHTESDIVTTVTVNPTFETAKKTDYSH